MSTCYTLNAFKINLMALTGQQNDEAISKWSNFKRIQYWSSGLEEELLSLGYAVTVGSCTASGCGGALAAGAGGCVPVSAVARCGASLVFVRWSTQSPFIMHTKHMTKRRATTRPAARAIITTWSKLGDPELDEAGSPSLHVSNRAGHDQERPNGKRQRPCHRFSDCKHEQIFLRDVR